MAAGDRIGIGNKFYTPLAKEITYSAASGISIYATQLSITGSGYLNKCVFLSGTASYTMTLRVTIDGVIWYLGNNISAGVLSGIANENLIVGTSSMYIRYSNATAAGVNGVTAELPYTGNSSVMCFIDTPLQFKNSLLIEAMGSNTGLTAGKIAILGGIG